LTAPALSADPPGMRVACLGLALVVLTGCVIREKRDPQEEARARYAAASAERDRHSAERRAQSDPERSRRMQESAVRERAVRTEAKEDARVRDALKALRGSCRELDELEATIEPPLAELEPETRGEVAARIRKRVEDRRREHASLITSKVEHAMGQRSDMAEVESPDDGLGQVEEARRTLAELDCYRPDASRAADLRVRLDAWAASVERGVAEEKRCRATPLCMGDRIAEPLCEAIRDRRLCFEQMATERRNPSGYVNKGTLHDLGRQIQDDDAKIAALRKEYAHVARVPFSEARCPKKP
jgi:hypothetical protein